jgi:arylsulfatase A-like enzyme
MKALGVIAPAVKLSPRHPKVPAWKDEMHKAWQERRMEVYAAQVTIMDRVIGRVLDHLRESGQLDDTLTFFTIDNGGCHVEYGANRKGDYLPEKTRDGRQMKPGNLPNLMPGPEITYQSYGYGWANLSNTPYRLFKQYDHEGGIHTPMIAHWPKGIKAKGKTIQTLSHLVDLMPTILDATKVDPPNTSGGMPRIQWNGQSLLPSLQGKKQPDPTTLFFHHAKGRALRSGKWKLVFNRDNGKKANWELYDLANDPNEIKDLAKGNPKQVKALAKIWEAQEKALVLRGKD